MYTIEDLFAAFITGSKSGSSFEDFLSNRFPKPILNTWLEDKATNQMSGTDYKSILNEEGE